MEFDKQYFLVSSTIRDSRLRKGQFIFNMAHKLYPNEVNAITGTVYDCFYLDEKIDLFLEKMKQLVERKEDVVIYDKPITTYDAVYENKLSEFPKEGIEVKLPYDKQFYRLGESMENRKLRGAKV